jgi:hypothetical protein
MNQKKKAIWWFFPSLLEPCDGPWGRLSDFGHDPVLTWKAIIDWAAKLKVNHLIPGIEPYASDRVYNQWGFHYVCHFPADPAARCFDDDTIRRNIATIRAIAAYGRERNVGIMFHHYNLMAPERWVQSHPRLQAKFEAVHDPVWGHAPRNDRMGNLVSNLCWNNPEYKAFMQRCWREVFANIPELAGAMITAGEFSHCACDQCTGGTPVYVLQDKDDPAEAARAAAEKKVRDEKRGEMSVDLIRTFTGILKELNKVTIVRSWFMAGWVNRLPKGIDYASKYSLFDACWGGPDPVIHQWLAAGHKMWETVAIEAENCGPVLWHDEEWNKITAERNNALDIQGCIIHINTQWGHTGHIGSFTASRNITRLLEGLSPVVKAGKSETEFCQFFGPDAGPPIYRAAKLVATFPLHMTATVHLAREGFSFGMPPWFDGDWRWPGVLGSPRYQPEPWANPDGLTTIYELLQAVAASPDVYRGMIDTPKGSAISRCDEIASWCLEACGILETCPAPHTPQGRSEWRALTASAHIATWAAREYAAVLRARVAWEAVKHAAVKSPDAAAARAVAVTWYEKAVDALNRQIPWAMELARIYPDAMNHITESHETFNRLTMATRLRIRRDELQRIRTVKGPDWEKKMMVEFWPHLPPTLGSGAAR